MLFNSLTFLVFFAVVLLVDRLPLRWTLRKLNLLVASYLFYAAWNPPFVLLLILSAVVDFYLASAIDRTDQVNLRRGLLAISLVVNLGLLSYFKYGTFLLNNFTLLLNQFGVHYQAPQPNLILPLGISFYTFETVSYLIDVFRRRIRPCRSFLDYALFLTFFPHLVAGPIVRAGDFLPQCVEPKRATLRQLGWGLSLMVVGLFEKVILADSILAPVADSVFSKTSQSGFADAWLGTLAFSGQIFCDFAGYSSCGIGAALCLGFVLKPNFHFPYAAVGFSDFWQRWHISLSSWLRDYLYIPLGGNRRGTAATYRNLMVTMLLGGLWHGAAWQFVAWGGLHGAYLTVERALAAYASANRSAGGWLRNSALWEHWLARFLLAMFTFVLVCIAWVFFRAKDFSTAFHLLQRMFSPAADWSIVAKRDAILVIGLTTIIIVLHWILRDSSLERAVQQWPWWLRTCALTAAVICLFLAPGDDRAFIYFQF